MGGLSPVSHRVGPGFDPRPVYVRFVVKEATVGQVFLRIPQFSRVGIIPPLLHTNRIHVALTRING